MNHEQEVSMVRRILAHVEARTTDADPQGSRLAIGAYADAARIEREIGVLFRGEPAPGEPGPGRLPLAIAHASEIGRPGDFLTHDRSGLPLLVVRREDGGIDAFLNVCRHRGTRVEEAPRGNKRAFACPYHGWTYGKRGALVVVPHERGFACLDRGGRGLVRVAAGEACGLVFVDPSERGDPPDLDARATLGPIADDLDSFGLGSGVIWQARAVTRAISWKLAIDIFLETYHLRPTHRTSIYPMFFDNIGLVDRIGPHLRNAFPKRSIRELATTPESGWRLREHSNVLYHLFPGTLVLVQPDHAAVLHVWPEGPQRTTVASYLVVPEAPATEKAQRYWDANARILYDATDEDFAMGESIQRGLASGANADVVLGSYEHSLAHFHAEIERRTTTPPGRP